MFEFQREDGSSSILMTASPRVTSRRLEWKSFRHSALLVDLFAAGLLALNSCALSTPHSGTLSCRPFGNLTSIRFPSEALEEDVTALPIAPPRPTTHSPRLTVRYCSLAA